MPSNEKEYNGNLFDQLSILERIEAVTTDEAALKQIAIERKQIERKLYQKPPLIEQNWIMLAIKRMSIKGILFYLVKRKILMRVYYIM